MPTIAENLQTLVEKKQAIKEALQNQGKEPTDELGTYPGLIDALENPDNITYLVTVDGENSAYTVLHGQEKVELNATTNDIRIGTKAVTETGVTDGEKEIPAYYSRYGERKFTKGTEVKIKMKEYDDKSLMTSMATFNVDLDKSISVNATSIGDSMYECKSNTKLSDITKDSANEQINFGITANEDSVIRYFVVREEI